MIRFGWSMLAAGVYAGAGAQWLAVARLSGMDASAVVLIVLFAAPLVLVGVMFVWAAVRDGEEDKAIQRRLGIRRKTRLGR
jgi:hypothetical protein